jgi:hypothetical protein
VELTLYHCLIIAAFIGIVFRALGRKREARYAKDARTPWTTGSAEGHGVAAH